MVDVEHTEVSARRGGTRQVGRDRVAWPVSKFREFLSKFGWARLSAEILRNLGGPARNNERGVLSEKVVRFAGGSWIQDPRIHSY